MFYTTQTHSNGRAIVSAVSGAVLASYRPGTDRAVAEAAAKVAYNAELASLADCLGGDPHKASAQALREAWQRKVAA